MKILDACCGSKMFWFDREHKETVYMDNRTENTTLCDGRKLIIKPELAENTIFAEGHYDLTYRRKDKSKCSCRFAVSLETFYGRGNDLEKNVYLIKTEAKRLMLEGELENDE